jgi:hypothetical protein
MYIDKRFSKYDIYIFRNLIPTDTCEKVRDFIEKNDKCCDRANNNYLNNYYVTDEIKAWKIETDLIEKYTNKIIDTLVDIPFMYTCRIAFRKVFGETKLHKDGLDMHTGSKLVRTSSLVYSFSNNKGGVFTFPRQNVSFQLNEGDVAIFPPYWTHAHRVSAPEPDTYRYTAVAWVYHDESTK